MISRRIISFFIALTVIGTVDYLVLSQRLKLANQLWLVEGFEGFFRFEKDVAFTGLLLTISFFVAVVLSSIIYHKFLK